MPSPKKSGLALILGMGGPKSKNPNGVSDSSISAPDQSGDALAPGGSIEEEMAPEIEVEVEEEVAVPDNSILLPPGFQPPDGSESDFTTTVRGKIVGDRLEILAIGDMPMKGGSELPAAPEEEVEELVIDDDSYAKKKAEEKMAKNAFQV